MSGGRNRSRVVGPSKGIVSAILALVLVPLAFVSPARADTILPDTATDLGVEVILAPIAVVPNSSFGVAPRLNAMATTGDRLFVVVERHGLIYELVKNGDSREATVFFDVGAAIEAATDSVLDTTSSYHGGLRSLAFHPDFASNGLLYVSAMETRPANPGAHHYLSDVATPIAADSVLLEFTANPGSGVVDPLSYREVFRVGMPVYDHPIKQISFNPFSSAGDPDYGLLYIGHGDGSVQSATAGGGRLNDALGKILRINPLSSGSDPYSVPADNPFVGDPSMLDEVYSLGHRNPHNLSFADEEDETVLIVAEPGRDNIEEVNLITAGSDYGWPEREGTFVHLAQGGVVTGVGPLPADEATLGFTYPALQYGHEGASGSFFNGAAIAGGYTVDNGSELSGQYFFADFPKSGDLFHASTDALRGAVSTLDPVDPARDEPAELATAPIGRVSILFDHDNDPTTPALVRTSLLDVFDDAPTYATNRADVRFGQGPAGELYITSKRNNTVYLVTNSVAPDPTDPPVDPPTDPPGVRVGLISEATSIAEIVAATDYQEGDARILRLYQAFFDRGPDVDGAKYWLTVARSGQDAGDITEYFAASQEFRNTYGQSDDSAFLVIVYGNVLDRAFDQDGFDYWLDQMSRGLSKGQVVLYFSAGLEFRNNYPYLPG